MIERKVFIFMLFLLFFIPINAKIDTERNQQIEYIESVLKLVESDIKPRNAGQTVKDAYRALKLSEKIGYQRGVIKAHYIIALSYFYSVEYKLAMQYVSKIETLKDVKSNYHYITQMHYLKGRIYFIVGLYDLAIEELETSLESISKVDNENIKNLLLANIYSAFARIYYEANYEENITKINYYLSLSHRAHMLLPKDYSYTPFPEYFIMKTETHLRQNNLDSAKYYVGMMKRYSLNKRYIGLPHSYVTMGNYYLAQNMPDSAYYYYRFALKRTEESGVVYHMPALYQGFANYFKFDNQPDSVAFYEMKFAEEQSIQSESKLDVAKDVMLAVLNDSSEKYNRRYAMAVASAIILISVFLVIIVRTYNKRKRDKLNEMYGQDTVSSTSKDVSDFDSLIEAAKNNDPSFIWLFQNSYPDFWVILLEKHSNLTPAEQQLCALSYLNFSTKEIAEYADIQISSVQARRSRLRKKINLETDIDFGEYLRGISFNDDY